MLLRLLLEDLADSNVVLARPAHLSALARFALILRLEVAAAECAPGRQRHTFLCAHGDDVAFEVTLGGAPLALVDDELAHAVVAGVLVGLGHDPGGGIADAWREVSAFSDAILMLRTEKLTEVEDLALISDRVEGLHHFRNRSSPVPPVDIENIDIAGPELLQAGFQADVEGLGIVSGEVGLQSLRRGLNPEVGCVLRHPISESSLPCWSSAESPAFVAMII